jgi:hypothetical protein
MAEPQHPEDVPAARPPALDRLDALVGSWQLTAYFGAGYFGPGAAPVTGDGGRTVFEWLDGRSFLIQRFTNDHPAAPSGLAVIGVAAGPDAFVQHYYDSRGVARDYQMSLAGGTWRLWREEPGFWQRYTGTFAPGGDTIDGAWEMSADGSDWRHDFRLTYTRIG